MTLALSSKWLKNWALKSRPRCSVKMTQKMGLIDQQLVKEELELVVTMSSELGFVDFTQRSTRS